MANKNKQRREAKKAKGVHKMRGSLELEFEIKRLQGRSCAKPKTWGRSAS